MRPGRNNRFAIAPALCGGLVALYLLSGRWTLSRLNDASAVPAFYHEIRFWVVLLLLITALLWNAGKSTVTRGSRQLLVLMLACFLGYLVLSVAWAPDHALAGRKAYEVVLVAIASLALARILFTIQSEGVLVYLWAAVLSIAGALAVIAFATMLSSGVSGERLSVLGGGPNVFGRMMAYLAIAALFLWKRHGFAWVYMPIVTLALVLVLLSGSRGSLVALSVALVAFAALEVRSAGRLLPGLALAIAAFLLMAKFTHIGQAAVETYERRIVRLLLEEQYTAGRSTYYASAYKLGMASPVLGDGLAAFPARGLGVYPHNMFLETFCEAGIVGVWLLVLVLAVGLICLLRRKERPDAATLAGLVLILVASQFSGDFYDNSRSVFVFLLAVVRPPPEG